MHKILVVDDDTAVRDLLVAILLRQECDVTAVADGVDALRALDTNRFDCIILDLMMPKMRGHEVLEHLAKSEDQRKNVIVLTAAQPRHSGTINDARVHSIIRKPFDLDDLRNQVQQVTRRGILIVEDNPADQYLIEQRLVEAGYDVTTVQDGVEALKSLRDRDFDAIVLDIKLPVISGYDVIDSVSTRATRPPTVVLSMLETFERPLAADAVLHKPQGIDQLVHTLRGLSVA